MYPDVENEVECHSQKRSGKEKKLSTAFFPLAMSHFANSSLGCSVYFREIKMGNLEEKLQLKGRQIKLQIISAAMSVEDI